MADVRDILGVPRGQAAERQEVPKTKEKVQRPAGMSREAFALLGGSHPIVPSQLTEELRKKEDLKGLKEKRKNAKGQVSGRHMSHAVHACHALPAQRNSLSFRLTIMILQKPPFPCRAVKVAKDVFVRKPVDAECSCAGSGLTCLAKL